jgi:uncharacterized protein YkwD
MNHDMTPRTILGALLVTAATTTFVISTTSAAQLAPSIDGGATAVQRADRIVPANTPPNTPPHDPPNYPSKVALNAINAQRAANGRTPLRSNSALDNAAQTHAVDASMFVTAQCGGASLTGSDGSGTEDRIKRFGYRYKDFGALFFCSNRGIEDLLASSKNLALVLRSNFADVGIGYAELPDGMGFWSLTFGEPV